MWSQADVDKLRAAILALACGEAVQRVEFDGPPRRMVTYHPADLGKMRELLATMVQDVAAASGRANYSLLSSRKGV